MLKNRIIHDPFLDEFLYHLIYKASREQRDRFPIETTKIFKSSKAAKGFIKKATLEQKLYFLTLFGVEWSMVLGNRKTIPKDLKAIIGLFKSDKHTDALDLMIEKNIFVFSGEQFMDYMGVMGAVNHDNSYSYNIELKKAGYHLKKWQKNVSYKNYDETVESGETYSKLLDLVLKVLLNEISVEANHGLKENDLMILLFLYSKRSTNVSHEFLWDYFGGYIDKREVSQTVKRLRDKYFVRASAISKQREYAITTLGINSLNMFIKKTLLTNF